MEPGRGAVARPSPPGDSNVRPAGRPSVWRQGILGFEVRENHRGGLVKTQCLVPEAGGGGGGSVVLTSCS